MDYAFNLEWDELPQDLKDEKVRQYILASDLRDCDACDGVGEIATSMDRGDIEETKECQRCEGSGQVEPDADDIHQQEEAEEIIRTHFPLYF